ncbi:MAG TPA: PSD1 and planctomycete cytochrome C domain-containing protein [Terracidiphilus sp.]|nr:PSD1 and planctomycete cytochrome C domain-containing protein [Terracidiphilus sp.]
MPGNTVIASGPAPDPGSQQFYSTRVVDILQNNCLDCHDETAKGGLRLDSYAGIRKGGADGAVIVPGDPEASMLVQAIRRQGDLKMPPKNVLDPAAVADLVAWVKAGAVGADPAPAGSTSSSPAPSSAPQVSATGAPSAAASSQAVPVAVIDADFFENKVRPIFANSCYDCHDGTAKGGFRLDTREGFEKGGKSGAEIVPGNPDKSRLIQAVEQTGDLKMPKGGKLKPEEVAALVAWVKAGANWPASAAAPLGTTATTGVITDKQREFWSFQPLKNPAIPAIVDKRYEHWARTPIDRFILANLHSAGLNPAEQADRRTLIRRATYDLTGLPPTEQDVEAFVNDRSPNAWEKVVDRLLASPRYGERWGRHWLDVARYSEDDVRGLDPKGRGYMPFAGAYRYRDWVIKSFNDDLAYDKFIEMQLAGDRMPFKTEAEHDDNLVATTYLGAGPWVWDQAEPVQGRADERNERVDAVTRGLLGLTVACARCHNHKYDPIAQKDYYSVVSIFASSTYKNYPVVSPAVAAAYDKKVLEEATVRADLRDYTMDLSKQMAGALAIQSSDYMVAAWHVLSKEKKTVDEAASSAKLDPEVLQRWVDYLGKDHPYPYLNDWKAMMAAPESTEEQAKELGDAFQKTIIRVRTAGLDVDHQNEIIKAKNDVPDRRVLIDTNPGKFDTFDEFCPGCELELKALPFDDAKLYSDIYVTQSGDQEEHFKPGVLVFTGWSLTRRLGPAFQDYIDAQQKKIKELDKELKDATYPYVNGETDKAKPVDVNLNIRGNPHSLGPVIQRGFITVLSPPGKKPYADGSGRLEFAEDIANHPLAARVIVNRVWKWHFGTGLVNTPDNFGVMGDKPSNPDLLEYLASEFVSHGRSIKWLQREIMLSAVYQESTDESQEAHDKDGGNRLYSHFNRQRLDAEEIRDSMLDVAGDLDLKETSGPSTDFSEDNVRRTVFCKVSRYRLNNYLMIFDFPNPSFTAEQRFSSNVPLQQLYFMNNSFVYKQAGVLADRVASEPSDEARIDRIYEYIFQRKPTAEELQLGLKFLSSTPDKPGYAVTGKPLTAWDEYARVLLSSNEFQFVN